MTLNASITSNRAPARVRIIGDFLVFEVVPIFHKIEEPVVRSLIASRRKGYQCSPVVVLAIKDEMHAVKFVVVLFDNEWNIMLIDELCAAYTSDGARSMCHPCTQYIVDVELSKEYPPSLQHEASYCCRRFREWELIRA